MNTVKLKTLCGDIVGLDNGDYVEFRGIKYADAGRWEYPVVNEKWDGVYDATAFGDCCYQHRGFEDDAKVNPFYHREFRRGMSFTYSEDCQYLNISAPKNAKNCPVLLYIHGGSFTGGSSNEGHISGKAYAENDIVFVSVNYRLGPYGFCSHPDVADESGVCGNFGLFDQAAALKWIKNNISSFGGDPDRITLLGQSAGAMSVDVLLSSPLTKDMVSGAVMLSGAALQRALSRPLSPQKMKKFWDEIIKNAGKTSLSELRGTDAKTLYYAWLKACRDEGIKSTLFYTLPCDDGKLLTKDTFNIKTISAMPKILGVTTADMIPIVLKLLVKKWVRNDKGSKCFVYLFARDLPGDNCGAWHSSDLPYVFSTLKNSWRPFTDIDCLISEQMVSAISAFVKSGDPNCREIPTWKPGTHKVMNFCEKTRLAGWKTATLIKNTLFNKGPVL